MPLGPWIIEELLARWDFPDGVTVTDVGTPGLDLIPYLADADIDPSRRHGQGRTVRPGSIRIYSREQLLAAPSRRPGSHHTTRASSTRFFSLEFAGSAPARHRAHRSRAEGRRERNWADDGTFDAPSRPRGREIVDRL